MTALLLLGCSQRKRGGSELTQALWLYDGPLARIARNWRVFGGGNSSLCDVWFVSAKYGLIHESALIRDYDCRMTTALAESMRPALHAAVHDRVLFGRYDQIAVSLGQLYWETLGDALEGVRLAVRRFEGGIGQRAKALKAWLHGLEVAQ